MKVSGQPHTAASLFLVKELTVSTDRKSAIGSESVCTLCRRENILPLLEIKPLLLQALYSPAVCRLKRHLRFHGVLDADHRDRAV
jgi:hypothetical protein